MTQQNHAGAKAQLAPKSRAPSEEEWEGKLREELRDFGLSGMNDFSIVVEGTTDRDYLIFAAELAMSIHGLDLLELPSGVRRDPCERIGIYAPGTQARKRGGTSRMERLAETLKGYCLTWRFFGGLVFIFDWDQEGKECCNRVNKMGYKNGPHTILLEPHLHPSVTPREDMMVEDLLSLRIQRAFFDQGGTWCSVEYQRGQMAGFRWHNRSKVPLCEFVRANAKWEDVLELARLISRVRATWGFGDDPALFTI